ncbi:hypothetical protein ACI1MP_35220 [Kitasatospora griseola]|uniref:hypothetical protein n=1 Tax=Kitasatospora griseola TaxID=2064 RepID=UPI003855A983
MTTKEPGDDLWEEFVREFEKSNAVHEPSAAERAAERAGRQQQPPAARRRPGRWLVLPAAAVLLAAVGGVAYLTRPSDREPAVTAAPAPSVTASAASAAPAEAAAGAPSGAIPLTVFPEKVQGYTLVAKAANPDCTGSDLVGPSLAGLIIQGHGCLGVDVALYKDADGNQYNLALFTMKDPMDGVRLVNVLAEHVESYQVAVQLPPDGSGLRRLPADSPRVQGFAVADHGMLVGMAQWSDGRTVDFDKLSARLTPLTSAVTRGILA